MDKIYFYGKRGCGKTTKLLKLAAKEILDKKRVVFIIPADDYKEHYRERLCTLYPSNIAEAFFKEIAFMTLSDIKHTRIVYNEDTRYFIDDAQGLLIKMLFREYNPFNIAMTFDTEPGYSEELVPIKATTL